MKSGEFSLELINADTKEPMKEFNAPDGKVYIEAEPDLEYFIRCHHDKGPGLAFLAYGMTTVVLEVDGTSLGYEKPFYTNSDDLGLWKRQNGTDTMRALKLVLKKTQRASGSLSNSNAAPPVGTVKAKFYQTVYFDDLEQYNDYDKTGCLNQFSGSAPAATPGAKKAFASVSGSATVSRNILSIPVRRSGSGRFLGEVTLHYTSALGLSELGILAPIVPVATTSTGTRPRNDDPSATTEHRRKRIKAEPRVVSPSCPRSDDLIDLTGDD